MSSTTRFPIIPKDQITPLVAELLELIQLQMEEIQLLRDEIARLKNQKPKPKIKPSSLETTSNGSKTKKKKKRRKKSKTKKIEIHEVVSIKPDNLSDGSKLKDYQEYIVQDIIIDSWNTCYRRQRWQTPSGEYVLGQLPEHVAGSHFGSTMTAFILYQYYGCHVTQPLIKEQLYELGVNISTGQINNILINNKDRFHEEKGRILSAGLKVSSHINVDDTGARHKGKNGYCTHIGNEYFAWFKSTASKSRINFLNLLRGDYTEFVLNDQALEYMAKQKLPEAQMSMLSTHKDKIFKNETRWINFLKRQKIKTSRHHRIATEGALIGSITYHGFNPELAIISDDAGQFKIFLHGLCWVHAERTIQKIVGFNDHQNQLLEDIKTDIWQFYSDLKKYRCNPDETQKYDLEDRFNSIFTRKTGFATLDTALKRLYRNKSELLLVLKRPDVPLHNNLSERDIREYVKRRKISGSTRSDTGQECRDTFTSLKKTCRKLGLSFWQYLKDRIEQQNKYLPLAEILESQMIRSAR
jgi:Transposase IS66 family